MLPCTFLVHMPVPTSGPPPGTIDFNPRRTRLIKKRGCLGDTLNGCSYYDPQGSILSVELAKVRRRRQLVMLRRAKKQLDEAKGHRRTAERSLVSSRAQMETYRASTAGSGAGGAGPRGSGSTGLTGAERARQRRALRATMGSSEEELRARRNVRHDGSDNTEFAPDPRRTMNGWSSIEPAMRPSTSSPALGSGRDHLRWNKTTQVREGEREREKERERKR